MKSKTKAPRGSTLIIGATKSANACRELRREASGLAVPLALRAFGPDAGAVLWAWGGKDRDWSLCGHESGFAWLAASAKRLAETGRMPGFVGLLTGDHADADDDDSRELEETERAAARLLSDMSPSAEWVAEARKLSRAGPWPADALAHAIVERAVETLACGVTKALSARVVVGPSEAVTSDPLFRATWDRLRAAFGDQLDRFIAQLFVEGPPLTKRQAAFLEWMLEEVEGDNIARRDAAFAWLVLVAAVNEANGLEAPGIVNIAEAHRERVAPALYEAAEKIGYDHDWAGARRRLRRWLRSRPTVPRLLRDEKALANVLARIEPPSDLPRPEDIPSALVAPLKNETLAARPADENLIITTDEAEVAAGTGHRAPAWRRRVREGKLDPVQRRPVLLNAVAVRAWVMKDGGTFDAQRIRGSRGADVDRALQDHDQEEGRKAHSRAQANVGKREFAATVASSRPERRRGKPRPKDESPLEAEATAFLRKHGALDDGGQA